MLRKIKLFGFVISALLAMIGVFASGASAATFTASSYPAHGSGGQVTKHVLTVQGQKVECAEASFTGELTAASEQLTVTPTYNGCTAFGFIGAKVDMNGCDYLFEVGAGELGTPGSAHVQCPEGKQITITAGGCVVHIGPQTPGTPTVDYKNEGGSEGVLVTSTVAGISVSVTSSFPCTLAGGNSTASYTGTTLFKSTEGKSIDVAALTSPATFTASSYPAHGEGGQTTKHVLRVQGRKVECTEASFSGSLAAASEELTITPTYDKCAGLGLIGTKVDMNGCDYLFEVGAGETGTPGSVHVQCPEGKRIAITDGGCLVHIGPQTPGTPTVDYKNEGGTKGILVNWTVAGILVDVTSVFPCGLAGGASTMTYGGSTLFASTEGKSIDVG